MLCQVLDVSSSAFYAWAKNTLGKRQQENDVLSITINKHFSDSRKTGFTAYPAQTGNEIAKRP